MTAPGQPVWHHLEQVVLDLQPPELHQLADLAGQLPQPVPAEQQRPQRPQAADGGRQRGQRVAG
jgi:hypothetical protein